MWKKAREIVRYTLTLRMTGSKSNHEFLRIIQVGGGKK
jgi:hypothetical protein